MAELDAKRLMEEAEGTESGESYRTLYKVGSFRIGVGARKGGTFFVEVLINPFPQGKVDLDCLEACLDLLRRLKERDFALCCQDDSSISCEAAVERSCLLREVEAAQALAKAAIENKG